MLDEGGRRKAGDTRRHVVSNKGSQLIKETKKPPDHSGGWVWKTAVQ
jgi:hypothetical protein